MATSRCWALPTPHSIPSARGRPTACTDFHDIKDNSTNLFYHARETGFDDATGIGTFNGANMLADPLISGISLTSSISGAVTGAKRWRCPRLRRLSQRFACRHRPNRSDGDHSFRWYLYHECAAGHDYQRNRRGLGISGGRACQPHHAGPGTN